MSLANSAFSEISSFLFLFLCITLIIFTFLETTNLWHYPVFVAYFEPIKQQTAHPSSAFCPGLYWFYLRFCNTVCWMSWWFAHKMRKISYISKVKRTGLQMDGKVISINLQQESTQDTVAGSVLASSTI